MDAADRDHGHGHPIETSLLPLKKRASNYSSGDGRISAAGAPNYSSGDGGISIAGDPYASISKKKRMADNNNSVVVAKTKDTTGALEAPVPRQQRPLVPRQRRPVPAAASRDPAAELLVPVAASPEHAAEGNVLSESDQERKRLNKGKWVAREDMVTITPQPPVIKKLMHDGIRSFARLPQQLRDEHRHAAAAEADNDVPLPLHGSPALSSALKQRLAELGATRPWLVLSKKLQKSDVDENQNRLLVSCKRGSRMEDSPITRCFSPDELDRVKKKHAGLCVTALDRDGFLYTLTCKFLTSNSGYRFINEWKQFLIQNGMNLDSQKGKDWERNVEVELWAFRSRQLPFQPQIDAEEKVLTLTTQDEDGKKVTAVQRISHHLHPDGSLGLLLLLHENEEDDDWKGPSSRPSVTRKKGKQQSGKRGASALASPVALPAPVAEQGGASRPELTFYAALGLAKLRQAIRDRRQEQADRGHGAKGLSNNVAKCPADVKGDNIDIENKKAWERGVEKK